MRTNRLVTTLSLLAPLALPGPIRGEDAPEQPRRPNVLLIVTDDQGYGDLGFHGNPTIRTPRLDTLAKESTRFRSFYVSPVCSPTRVSLMTGRYNFRTGVVDTFRGRSLMHPDETTIAEMLAASGYRTGIFGKWHLGDNVPFRPMDQGFQESLIIKGGGVGQPSDPPGGGGGNFDPILQHNGRPEPTKGFTTDLFADATIRFIEADRSRPFFAALTFNAPHTPLDVPDADGGRTLAPNDSTGRVYAMLSRVDRNIGRVLDRLDQLGLTSDTLVIYLSDNGPQQVRYNANLRDRKGNVHDGGIRVPCFVRWPGVLGSDREVEPIAAHIDLAPTILAACRVDPPANVAFDGRNLLPLLRGESVAWPDRVLFFQWHRGDQPEIHRAFAARAGRYKLVQAIGASGTANTNPAPLPVPPRYELFDMLQDPFERHDLAATHPNEVASLLRAYEGWFRDVTGNSAHAMPRIHLGSPRENPTTLTRQDWRGEGVAKDPNALGGWDLEVIRAGTYDLTFRFDPGPAGAVEIETAGELRHIEIGEGATGCATEGVAIPAGPTRLRAWVRRGATVTGVSQIDAVRRE